MLWKKTLNVHCETTNQYITYNAEHILNQVDDSRVIPFDPKAILKHLAVWETLMLLKYNTEGQLLVTVLFQCASCFCNVVFLTVVFVVVYCASYITQGKGRLTVFHDC